MRAWRTARLTFVALAALSACDQLFDIQERQPLPEAGIDASPAEGGVDSATDTALSDAPACSGTTLYVSNTTGSDASSGCTSTAPKKTIGAALAVAAGIKTIQVCKGTYDENPLVVTTATSLLGAYNCLTWTRAAKYGYPTFDAGNATVIQNAAVSTASATLSLSGAGVTSSVVVDGFTILGATSGTTSGPASAVLCQQGASPTLSNNQLTGGSLTSPTGAASIGVLVLTGANPVITSNKINGGSGVVPPSSSENGRASNGILADGSSAQVTITGNTISGGSGAGNNSSAGGSAGVVLLGTATPGPSYTVRGNTIVAGTGTSAAGTATVGFFVNGTASLVLDSNSIDGGGGSTGTVCSTGVFAGASGALTITANRIYGGNCGVSTAATAPAGIRLSSTTATVYDNMIHAGTATNTPTIGSSAIRVDGLGGADIRHNTLIGGPSNGAVAQALWLNTGTSGTKVVNNILAGSGNDAGLVISPCTGAPALQAFENNLVFASPLGLLRWATCFGGASYATVDGMTANLLATQSGATVQGNVTLASSCTTDAGTDSGCVPSAACTSPQTCLSAFFGNWDVASNGYKNLFPAAPFAGACPTTNLPPQGNGWTIGSTTPAPCKVTRSTLDDHTLTGLGVNLYGNCRTATPSMGAEEDSSATCQ